MDCMGSPTTKMVRPERSGQAADESGDEFVLAATGVLEFVDEQVANIIGDGECGIGGQLIFVAEDLPGDLCDFNEVDRAGVSEDGLQFACGVAEKDEAGANDLPIFVAITGRRKSPNAGKSLFQAGHGGELLDQILVFAAFLRCAPLESRERC